MIINDSKGKDEMTKKKVKSAINHKVSYNRNHSVLSNRDSSTTAQV